MAPFKPDTLQPADLKSLFKSNLLNLNDPLKPNNLDSPFSEHTNFYKTPALNIGVQNKPIYTPQPADPSSFEALLNKSRGTFNQSQIGIANQINPAYGAVLGMATGNPFTLKDNSGTATITPGGQLMLQTNLFDEQGNPIVNPKGWRFGIDAAHQSASVGKGIFDLSAGVNTTPQGTTEPIVQLGFDTKLNNSQGIQPVNMQQFLNQPKMIDPRDAATQDEINSMRLPQARYW
jgi:hypothetical protein